MVRGVHHKTAGSLGGNIVEFSGNFRPVVETSWELDSLVYEQAWCTRC